MEKNRKRDEKYEGYMIDNNWKTFSKDSISNFKILAIPLENNQYYYTFSGLLLNNTKVLKPEGKKCKNESPDVLFSSKNYELAKYFFVKMLNYAGINKENISDDDTYDSIKKIYAVIK